MLKYGIVCIVVCFCNFGNAQISDFKHIRFIKADSIAKTNTAAHLDNLPYLAEQLTQGLTTDVEKFRAIYKWVCLNIGNDYNLYKSNAYNRKRLQQKPKKYNAWQKKFRKKLFKTLTKRKKTICTGYAYVIQYLCKFVNLNVEIVQGYGRVSTTTITKNSLPNHSWIAVKLNNTWYLADPTWASGIPNNATGAFEFNYNDSFFLATPQQFSLNHFPEDNQWWLMPQPFNFETFLNLPIFYGETYTYIQSLANTQQLKNVVTRQQLVSLSYNTKNTTEKSSVVFKIFNGYSTKTVHPHGLIFKNNTLTLQHRFEHKGIYDVHVYINKAIVASYIYTVN